MTRPTEPARRPPQRPLPPHLDPRRDPRREPLGSAGRGSGRDSRDGLRHDREHAPSETADGSTGRSGRSPQTPVSAQQARRHRASRLRRLALVASAAILAISLTGYALVTSAVRRVQRVDVFTGLQDRPADAARGALDILVVGSDSREGLSRAEQRALHTGSTSSAAGRRTDTMILMHLSRRRDGAVLVSLPRDSLVEVPSWGGRPAHRAKLNSAYAEGGPALAVATLERATGVRVDHYLEVDFGGFVRIVDALGGVDVCLPHAVDDPLSGLKLPAGVSHVDGASGLAYVRARAFDPRADLGRIERQQQFVAAMVRRATSADVVGHPVRFVDVLQAGLAALRADPELGTGELRALALQLRGLSPGAVRFTTVPLASDSQRTASGAVVAWDDAKASALFRALREDEPLEAPARLRAVATVAIPPQRIRVSVRNGSGEPGLARRGAQDLRAVGFRASADANAEPASGSVVRYGTERADSARTVAAAVPGATLELDPSLGPRVVLVVGSSYTGARSVRVAAAEPGPPHRPRTAADSVCGPQEGARRG